jgi:hypothetical protein
MRKGDLVTYVPSWSKTTKPVIEARVRRVHRDGSVSIEATFCRDDSGERVGCYLGLKQRVCAYHLTVVA